MPDPALPGLGALQRERLQALGYELLELRAVGAGSAPTSAAPAARDTSRARLRLRAGEDARLPLLRSLLRALGVGDDAVVDADSAGAERLPLLAIGDAGSDAMLAVPSLHALRDPAAKRRLWPALRRLRRALRDA